MNAIDWNTYAKAYDLLLAIKPYRAMHHAIATVIENFYLYNDGLILDAGCGTGNLLTTLAEHNVPRSRIIGVDGSPIMCGIATQKHSQFGATIRAANLDERLPFETGIFPVIACVNALYAVRNPLATLREFARVLKPDGLLVIATPHKENNLGLILKAHCGSQKPDAYWMQYAEGGNIARELLGEAFAHDNFDMDLLEILFATNTAITTSSEMHFLSSDELRDACASAGLHVFVSGKTYADQALLMYATSCVNHTKGVRHAAYHATTSHR